MSGGSFGYPRHKSADEIGRHNLQGMIALLEETGHGASVAAADLRAVLAGLEELDATLNDLADLMNTLDRVPSGDDSRDDIAPGVAAYDASRASAMDQTIDDYFDLREQVFAHVGYVEDWRVFPLDDMRGCWWWADPSERGEVRWSPSEDALRYWLGDHDDEYGPYGNQLYGGDIYTNRHLPKWLYRGPEFTLALVDTHTDGNILLMVFRNDHEVKK